MRLAYTAWRLQLVQLSRSPFFLSLALVTPVAFVTIFILMSGGTSQADSGRLAIGAGLMGAWSTVLFGAGESLYMQRFTGTLRLLLSSPRGMWQPIIGFAAATATLGVYSIAASVLWAWLVLDADFNGFSPVLLAGSTVLALLSLLAMGLVLAPTYVLSRQALTISNILDYPVWLIAGVVIPVTSLSRPLQWLNSILPFSWAVRMLDDRIPTSVGLQDAAMCVLLSVSYAGIGVGLLRRVDRAVRWSGKLELR